MKNTVSILPSPTWNWLKVNDITIEHIDTIGSMDTIKFTKTGDTFTLPYLHELSARECVDVQSEEGAKGTLIIDHKSSGKGGVFGLTLNFDLGVDSDITIVEVVRMDNADTLLSGMVGKTGEGARLKVIQVFLSGKDVYSNVICDLLGDCSSIDLESAYKLYKENYLDINYVVNHIGKKTECSLESKGVLYRGAKKTYRGTIDFKKGCKGSVGNETEDVLLMDEDVVNKTVPVILCAEEDVEGNHGATIGKLSNELMFYLESRGIPEDEIYKMMANSRIESVIRHIPSEGFKEELLEGKEDAN